MNMDLSMLIVDDEPLMRQGFKMMLDWNQYGIKRVFDAQNGYEAIEKAERERPEIIVTDVRMPEIDGLQLIKRLKAILTDSVFLIISGYSDFEYAKQAITLGVMHYMVKPISYDELQESMEKCINEIKEKRRLSKLLGTIEVNALNPINDVSNDSNFNEYKEVIADMKKHIKQNLKSNISLNDLAEMFHYNPSYLSRFFKKEIGMNFSDYIKKVRIDEAKELFSTTDMTAFNICQRVGYTDYRYFMNIFKEATGVTPHMYKTRGRKKRD